MRNKILAEQCNKLNYLYFDVLRKLVDYEDSIKNIHKLKETLIKKEYILIELQEKFSKAILEINKNNQEIDNLKNIIAKKNMLLKQNKKNLDYYFQLNQKLLIEADNIDMNPKILALKNEYENKINEYKKSLTFYKEENYRKDRIILDLNTGDKDEYDRGGNKFNNAEISKNKKKFFFKNAQKVNKDFFINKENIDLKNKINLLQEKIFELKKKLKEYELKEKYQINNKFNSFKLKNINNKNNQTVLGNNYN